MKAWVRERYGTPEVLSWRDLPKAEPKPDEVRVRVRAVSINDWDWSMLIGDSLVNKLLFGLSKVPVIGCDVAGDIEAVGAAVRRFRPGDAVHGDVSGCGFGAFAEYVCVPERALVQKPAAMSFAQAAALPQAGALAMQGLLDAGHLQSGQRVLLNGAGGGVGTLALQVAKAMGAHVTAVDHAMKLDRLLSLGADRVIDYQRENFTHGKDRYDLILDVKTHQSPFAYARALAPRGTYVTVGGSMPRLLQTLVLGPPTHALSGKGLRLVALKPNRHVDHLNAHFEAGRLNPVLDEVHPFAHLPAALQRFSTGQHFGKIIVTLD